MPPPPAPAEEPPAQSPPRSEALPGEQREEAAGAGVVLARLLLQPPSALLVGATGGYITFLPSGLIAIVACAMFTDSQPSRERCTSYIIYPSVAIGMVIGASGGVFLVGHRLKGHGRPGHAILGAAMGSAVGTYLALRADALKDFEDLPFVLFGYQLVGSTLGAMAAYTISDVFLPWPGDAGRRAERRFSIMPLVSTTRTGGLVGGIAGQFY